ncbi:MAG: hypothetical protein ACW98D_16715 [Promethearchaeota archaeon]|jgi:hypothetical protein
MSITDLEKDLAYKYSELARLEQEGKVLINKMMGQPSFIRKIIVSKMIEVGKKVIDTKRRIALLKKDIVKAKKDAELEAKLKAEEKLQQDKKNALILANEKEKIELANELRAIEEETKRLNKLVSGDFGEDEGVTKTESSRILSGANKESNTKKYIIIGAVTIAVVIGGYFAYKKFKK